jgi:hypothetical protein
MPEPVKVFYSYAHKDESLRDELAKHLSPLQRRGLLYAWRDRRIPHGSEWDPEIKQHLGIRLRRDSLVSVRYAEELNSTTSSVTLQRTDRHGILGQKSSHLQVSL